ncbi:MAG TPA: outer membrane protein assembly factor BamA [bacterium]|nr:outer membrane protein assembly factor BamA [bacterium]
MRDQLKFINTAASLLLALVLCLPPLPAFAAGPVVRAVEFTGNVRTPEDTLRNTVRMASGATLNLAIVDRDIKALYALGQFRDVRAETVPAQGGVKLIYALQEKPVIAEIAFSGNKKIKSEDLRKDVTVHAFTALDERAVIDSKQKIAAAYAKKGYYLASVGHHLETTEQGEAKLIFDVKENQGVIVRKVSFIGNKVFKDKELRDVVKTKEKTFFGFITGAGKYDEEKLKNDAMFLTYFYLNHGYLKVKVSPAKVTISKDKRYLFVTFQIHEGQQYKVGKVSISGDILTTPEELASLLKTKKGEIYSQKTLEEDLLMLTDRYGDEGYAYSSINPITTPDDDELTADINIRIAKGHRITIERINIEGNTTTRDKVIRRELELMENDRYSERLLRRSRERLMRLGFFEDVSFATPRGSRDDTMVLNILVKEKPTGSFNISAGFSTFEQFILNASIQKENFFGYGISGSISGELSKKRQLFMISMTDPYFLDSNWSVGLSGYRSAFNYTDFRREASGGEISIGRRFFDYFYAQVGYQAEYVKVSDFSLAVPQIFRANDSGVTSAVSLTLSFDRRDNRLYPRKGDYASVTAEISGSKLGGDNDFFRMNLRNQFYYPIYKSLIFQQFTRAGWIKSLNDKPVPLYERFFTGGPNSLRGFGINAVGPSLRIPASAGGPVQNFVYGGDKLLLFIQEIEFPIYDKGGIRGVAFFDAGNSFAENENFSMTNLRLDYGFGLRWNSPMGPLRFEWGFPIKRRAGEDSIVFNFTIGNFF